MAAYEAEHGENEAVRKLAANMARLQRAELAEMNTRRRELGLGPVDTSDLDHARDLPRGLARTVSGDGGDATRPRRPRPAPTPTAAAPTGTHHVDAVGVDDVAEVDDLGAVADATGLGGAGVGGGKSGAGPTQKNAYMRSPRPLPHGSVQCTSRYGPGATSGTTNSTLATHWLVGRPAHSPCRCSTRRSPTGMAPSGSTSPVRLWSPYGTSHAVRPVVDPAAVAAPGAEVAARDGDFAGRVAPLVGPPRRSAGVRGPRPRHGTRDRHQPAQRERSAQGHPRRLRSRAAPNSDAVGVAGEGAGGGVEMLVVVTDGS